MSTADQIRQFATRHYVQAARLRGAKTVSVHVGEVHQKLGLKNQVPNVCQALSSRKFLLENSLVLEGRDGPPSGQSTTVVFTYRLGDAGPAPVHSDFDKVRGIARAMFQSFGGGEAFLKAERASFPREEKRG